MNPIIPLPVAFGVSSFFVVVMLALNLLVTRMSRYPEAVDAVDRWLVGFFSLLCAFAAVAIQIVAIFG